MTEKTAAAETSGPVENATSATAVRDKTPRAQPTLPMPREHGAWGIYLTAFALGVAVAGDISWITPLVFVAGLCALLARRPALVAWQTRGRRRVQLWWALGLWLGVGGTAGTALVLRPDLWPLYALIGTLAVADYVVLAARLGRSAWGELPGIAGLSLVAALAHGTATPWLDGEAWELGLLSLAYFVGSIPYVRGFVKARYASRAGSDFPRQNAFPAVAYYVVMVNLVGALGVMGFLPSLAMLPLLPAVLKTTWLCFGKARLDRPIKQLGFQEVFHGVVFGAATWALFAFGG